MTTVMDQAVCLGRRDYSESSQIVTLFGRTHGKVRALAKGSRRAKARFGGGIDLLTAAAVQYVRPRGEGTLSTLTEFDLAESFAALRGDLLALNLGQYGAEMVDLLTEEFDPHEQLYDRLVQFLAYLPGRRPMLALVRFELVVFREVGLAPVFEVCSQCRQAVASRGPWYFSSSGGGAVCRNCEPNLVEKRRLAGAALDVLRGATAADAATPAAVFEAHETLSYHQREQIGKITPTMRFVNQLLARHVKASR